MTSQRAIMVTIIDGSHFTVTIIVKKCLYCNKNSKAFVVNFIVTHAFMLIRYTYSFTMNFANNYGKRFSVYRECIQPCFPFPGNSILGNHDCIQLVLYYILLDYCSLALIDDIYNYITIVIASHE